MKNSPPVLTKILVPVDFSGLSETAARYACGFAGQTKAEVTLLHVVDSDVPAVVLSSRLEQAQEGFRKLCRPTRGRPRSRMNIDYGVSEGLPFERMLEQYVQQHDMDLIIMGTKGPNALNSPLIGHNAAAVLSTCRVPVLLVPSGTKYRTIEHIAFFSRSHSKHEGMGMLARFAQQLHAATEVLYIGSPALVKESEGIRKELTEEFSFPELGVAVRDGEPPEKVLESFLQETRPDLLAIPRPQESFWDMLLGSNPSRTLSFHSGLPLLILHGE